MSRRIRGQAIVQSVLVLWLLASIVVGSVVILASAGMSIYYNVKLSHVARAGARYAVSSRYWLGAQSPFYDADTTQNSTISIVQTMLQQMGMGENTSTITVDQSDGTNCKVTVKVDQLPLWTAGFLPGFISVTATGSEAWMRERPAGAFGLTFGKGSTGPQMYLPAYGAGSYTPGPSSFPFGGFPYWASGCATSSPGIAGPLQNSSSGGAFHGY